MPGRSYSTGNYKFGFNGKENDNEIKGSSNSIDFGARIYDSRLGKWLSIDPLFIKFPGFSPYNFVENKPIIATDIEGKEIWIAVNINRDGKTTEVERVQYKDGKLFDKNHKEVGAEYKYTQAIQGYLTQLKKDDPDVARLVNEVENNDYENVITNFDEEAVDRTNQTRDDRTFLHAFATGENAIIQFDAFSTKDPKAKENEVDKKRHPRVGLAHELFHASDRNKGLDKYFTYKVKLSDGTITTGEEQKANQFENKVREKTGDPKVPE